MEHRTAVLVLGEHAVDLQRVEVEVRGHRGAMVSDTLLSPPSPRPALARCPSPSTRGAASRSGSCAGSAGTPPRSNGRTVTCTSCRSPGPTSVRARWTAGAGSTSTHSPSSLGGSRPGAPRRIREPNPIRRIRAREGDPRMKRVPRPDELQILLPWWAKLVHRVLVAEGGADERQGRGDAPGETGGGLREAVVDGAGVGEHGVDRPAVRACGSRDGARLASRGRRRHR